MKYETPCLTHTHAISQPTFTCSKHGTIMRGIIVTISKSATVNIRTMCEICLRLTIKTFERRHWRHSGVFIINSKPIYRFGTSNVNFEQVKYFEPAIFLISVREW